MATFGLDPHDPSYASILEQADEDGTYTFHNNHLAPVLICFCCVLLCFVFVCFV
eukprot:COSAG06_NODE_167_length_21546_cov_35.001352_13_plen_54_part_00